MDNINLQGLMGKFEMEEALRRIISIASGPNISGIEFCAADFKKGNETIGFCLLLEYGWLTDNGETYVPTKELEERLNQRIKGER